MILLDFLVVSGRSTLAGVRPTCLRLTYDKERDMPQLKLTKGAIDRVAKPTVAKGDVLYFDSEPRGFGLRVTPTGKATFIVQGRIDGSTKEARITIGPYGVFTVDQARDVAKEHLRTMRMGADPRDLKRQDIAMQVTLQDVCDTYVDRPGKLKESSKVEMKRHVDKVWAAFKDKPIVAITEDDVRKRHREMMQGGLDGKKAAPASANAAMVTLRILINFASRQYRRADGSPLIQRNPVEVMKDHWAELGSRTRRYIDKRTIGEVWNKLIEARENPLNRDAFAGTDLAILALLTGARRNELAQLTWNRVTIDDDEPANFHLPNPKNGREVNLPLSSQAVALLKSRPRIDGNPYVFPTRSKTGHIMDARAAMRLVSEVAGQRLSLHDMRRTFTNIAMRECLIEKFRTDLLTNHVPDQADVTSRHYLDLSDLAWLQPEVQKIGDWIEEQGRIAAAKAAGANVVPMRA
jgi:integrase